MVALEKEVSEVTPIPIDYKSVKGTGTHGKVALYTSSSTQKFYAGKTVPWGEAAESRELDALQQLQCFRLRTGLCANHILGLAPDLEPNVYDVSSHGRVIDRLFLLETKPMIRNLDQWLGEQPSGLVEDEETAACLLGQLMHAVALVHKIGWIHRDVKPANLCIVPTTPPQLWLTDFGEARDDGSFRAVRVGMTEKVGTPLYMAPEVLSTTYTNACDIYSAGATLLTCITGWKSVREFDVFADSTGSDAQLLVQDARDAAAQLLVQNARDAADAAESGAAGVAAAKSISDSMLELLQSMMHADPKQRPSAAEVSAQLSTRSVYRAPFVDHDSKRARLLLPPVPRLKAAVILMGSNLPCGDRSRTPLQGAQHCDDVLEYLQLHSPHLKEPERVCRLHEQNGDIGDNILSDRLAPFMDSLAHVSYDVLIWFHSAHGADVSDVTLPRALPSTHIVQTSATRFIRICPALSGALTDGDSFVCPEDTVVGYLQRHPALNGKFLVVLAGSCRGLERSPTSSSWLDMPVMPAPCGQVKVAEAVIQFATLPGKLANLTFNKNHPGDASWSLRLANKAGNASIRPPTANLMGWLHDVSRQMLHDQRVRAGAINPKHEQVVTTHWLNNRPHQLSFRALDGRPQPGS